jgi:hypothetical protein
MKKQAGFVFPAILSAISPSIWAILALSILCAILSGALYFRNAQIKECRSDYRVFVAEAEALGKIAEADSKREIERQQKIITSKDKELEKAKRDLVTAHKRLRDERRAGGSVLPPASQNSGSPQIACLRRAEFDAAFERFIGRIAELTEEGDSRITELNSAKEWAKELLKD